MWVGKTDGKMILSWRYRQEGISFREIASKFGVAEKTIRNWVNYVEGTPLLLKAAKSGSKIAATEDSISKNGSPPLKKKKRRRRSPKATDEKMISVWRDKVNNGLTADAIAAKFGVHQSTVFGWINKVNADLSLLRIAKSDPLESEGIKPIPIIPTSMRPPSEKKPVILDKMQEEINFLRWWNMGERKGYVDRLLKQIQE